LIIGEIKVPLEDKKQLVTSLRIDPEVWKEARVAAIQNDMTLTQLIEEAITCWIQMKTDMKQKK
jgi:predicted HicB family RNase H-like nuclease